MLSIQEYVRPQSLEEAYELSQNRKNIIVGGMLWLKMMNRSVEKAIDPTLDDNALQSKIEDMKSAIESD